MSRFGQTGRMQGCDALGMENDRDHRRNAIQ
jgi:hypothetical protein